MADPPADATATAAPSGTPWREILLTVGPVAGLIALALFSQEQERVGRFGGLEATILLVVLPLVGRRLWPTEVLVVVSIGALVTSAAAPNPFAQIAAVALASYTLGEQAADRTRSALVVLLIGSVLAVGFIAQDADALEGFVAPFMVLVPTWLLGDVVRSRRVEARRRVEAVERAHREREDRLKAAAAEERRHVARELHDVVAHAVSVMVIQAGAARTVSRTSPAEAEAAMLAVESTGREAMTELRRFLGALGDDETDNAAADLAPQPGITDLPVLLDRVREAGLPATLEIAGVPPDAVPASLEVTVYRIVQEALTNALRYARQAATLVRLSWETEQLRVEVLDDGPATTTGAGGSAGTGRGLVGMRERVSLAGGRFEAGPRVGGGYAVRAWLPIAATPPAAAGPA
jgi:signal transduction histidine kinase